MKYFFKENLCTHSFQDLKVYFLEEIEQYIQESNRIEQLPDKLKQYNILKYFNADYFLKGVSYVCEVLSSIQDSQANHKYITPKHVFYEFASTFERRLNAFVVECLALALSLKEVINQLIDCILDNVYKTPSSQQVFKMAQCVGIVI